LGFVLPKCFDYLKISIMIISIFYYSYCNNLQRNLCLDELFLKITREIRALGLIVERSQPILAPLDIQFVIVSVFLSS